MTIGEILPANICLEPPQTRVMLAVLLGMSIPAVSYDGYGEKMREYLREGETKRPAP